MQNIVQKQNLQAHGWLNKWGHLYYLQELDMVKVTLPIEVINATHENAISTPYNIVISHRVRTTRIYAESTHIPRGREVNPPLMSPCLRR